jgi:hypothetical protein
MIKFSTFLLQFFIPIYLFPQQVIFCEGVDRTGNPKNSSTEFTISNGGGFVKILVRLNKKVESHTAVFDVYRIVNRKEIFDNSLSMDIFPALTWFYKEITFYKEGDYHVYVYDEKDKMLGLGEVKINLR